MQLHSDTAAARYLENRKAAGNSRTVNQHRASDDLFRLTRESGNTMTDGFRRWSFPGLVAEILTHESTLLFNQD